MATTAKKSKIGEPVAAFGFKGMNNLPEAAAKLLDRERQITPQIILNADVTDGGVIRSRRGYTLTKDMANCHSLTGEDNGLSTMLCVADRKPKIYFMPGWNPDILALWISQGGGVTQEVFAAQDAKMVEILSSLGEVTVGVYLTDFDGSVDLSQYSLVVLLAGIVDPMPEAGQTALKNFIAAGGGLITGEWVLYTQNGFGLEDSFFGILKDVFCGSDPGGDFDESLSTTFTQVTANAQINQGLPTEFTFPMTDFAGTESQLTPANGVDIFYSSSAVGGAPGLMGRTYGAGKVAQFANCLGLDELSDRNFRQLFINTVTWAMEAKPATTSVASLWHVEGQVATELCEVAGPQAIVNYVEINNVIYASNPYWRATYDLATGAVSSWGVPLPPAPNITLVEGDLPPGTYSLCYTNVIGNRLGGNGPLIKIKWEGGAQGILLRNLPAGALCWITQPNGEKLFLAPVSGGVVSAQSPWMKPLPSFMVQPPPGFMHFVYAFGRIWGARGKQVFYSDPHQYEWFRPANFLPFLEDVVLIAPTTAGLFVNSLANTWFVEGTEPAKMRSRWAGNGAVPGTLAMVQVPANIAGGAQTNDLFAQLSKMPTPVWMSPTGFVVGTHGGNLTYLTENRLNLQPRSLGASLYRILNGIPQIISSLHGLPEGEDSLEEFFTRGRMYIPAPVQVVGSGGIEISGL